MSNFAISRDGTRVAYDSLGSGPVVVLVAGAMQFRAFDTNTVAMAALLAGRGFRVINFDRRGRGESAAALSFTLADTIEDLRAIIDDVRGDVSGGPVALVGNSSGGAISLAGAAAGLDVGAMVLFEVPLGPELGSDGAELLAGLRDKIAHGTADEVIEYFMKDMPPAWLDGARNSPGWPVMTSMGPSLEPDSESLAWAQSASRSELFSHIAARTLVLVGEQTLPLMPSAAESIAANIPHARLETMPAANHSWEPAIMAERIAGFLLEPDTGPS